MSVLVVDKPSGPSSFAVVKRLRGLLRQGTRSGVDPGRGPSGRPPKLGHGGTLDPFASGVLPICIDEATKILPFLLGADKSYEALVGFGVETDTLDRTGSVLAQRPVAGLCAASVESALGDFRGEIEQIPPMFSALKRDGRPLYSYARAGETVERAARKVTIFALEMVAFEPPDRVRLRLRCSKGTYVRVLAADLGKRLGVGAHLVELRRTASGPFRIDQAVTLEQVEARVSAGGALPLLSVLDALAHLPTVAVDDPTARVLAHGQRLAWASLLPETDAAGPVCAVRDLQGKPSLVAVVDRGPDGNVKILRGFASSG